MIAYLVPFDTQDFHDGTNQHFRNHNVHCVPNNLYNYTIIYNYACFA